MITFLDPTDNEYGALTEISYTNGVNGERSIKGEIFSNDKVLGQIDRGWRLRFEDEYYVVTYAKPIDTGSKVQVSFDAVHQFFWDFSKNSVYSQLSDGSHTFEAYLEFIFSGSGYSYSLEVNVKAFEKQSFGYKKRLTLFNDIITRAGVEFSVRGKVVRILERVGTDLSTIVRKNLNLDDLKITKNIGEFITYQKGFGRWNDDEDHSKGRLEVEYESPLAQVYGRLEGEPIVDERYRVPDNLLEALKKNVDNSYSLSVQLTMEDLKKAGYAYQTPRAGDYIMVINETIQFQERVRIVSFTSQYDIKGELIDHKVTCNDIGAVKKQSAQNSFLKSAVGDAQALSLSALESANRAMVSANGKNTIYHGTEMPIDEPKGTLRKGDTLFLRVGEATLMFEWTGVEWEKRLDTEDLVVDVEEFKNEIEKIQKEIDKVSEETDLKLKSFTPSLPDLNDIKNEIESIKGTSRINADLIGYDGITRYNKNLLVGEFNRTKPVEDNTLLIDANDGGFKQGETYTISFEAVCHLLETVSVIFNKSLARQARLTIEPIAEVLPRESLVLSNQTANIDLYKHLYTVLVSSPWYKSKRLSVDVREAQSIDLDLEYKDIADGSLETEIIGTWAEEPVIIFDGGNG